MSRLDDYDYLDAEKLTDANAAEVVSKLLKPHSSYDLEKLRGFESKHDLLLQGLDSLLNTLQDVGSTLTEGQADEKSNTDLALDLSKNNPKTKTLIEEEKLIGPSFKRDLKEVENKHEADEKRPILSSIDIQKQKLLLEILLPVAYGKNAFSKIIYLSYIRGLKLPPLAINIVRRYEHLIFIPTIIKTLEQLLDMYSFIDRLGWDTSFKFDLENLKNVLKICFFRQDWHRIKNLIQQYEEVAQDSDWLELCQQAILGQNYELINSFLNEITISSAFRSQLNGFYQEASSSDLVEIECKQGSKRIRFVDFMKCIGILGLDLQGQNTNLIIWRAAMQEYFREKPNQISSRDTLQIIDSPSIEQFLPELKLVIKYFLVEHPFNLNPTFTSNYLYRLFRLPQPVSQLTPEDLNSFSQISPPVSSLVAPASQGHGFF